MCEFEHVWTRTCRVQKRASDPVELELQVVMSYLIWVLGMELWCSARAISQCCFDPFLTSSTLTPNQYNTSFLNNLCGQTWLSPSTSQGSSWPQKSAISHAYFPSSIQQMFVQATPSSAQCWELIVKGGLGIKQFNLIRMFGARKGKDDFGCPGGKGGQGQLLLTNPAQ